MSKASRRRNARARRSASQQRDPGTGEPSGYEEGGAPDEDPKVASSEAGGEGDSPREPSPSPIETSSSGGGLMNGGPAPSAPSAPLEDPVLQRAEQKIEGQLLPKTRSAYLRVVVAGMQVGMAKEGKIMVALQHSKDPVTACAIGAINVGLMLLKESRNTMPIKALVPGCMTLMLKALDFCDKTGIKKIGTAELDDATKTFMNYMFHMFKITPQKLQVMATHVHNITQDPGQLDLLKRKAGLTLDPRANPGAALAKKPELPPMGG